MVLIILNSSFFFYYFSIFSKIISHLVKSIFSHKKFEKLGYLYSKGLWTNYKSGNFFFFYFSFFLNIQSWNKRWTVITLCFVHFFGDVHFEWRTHWEEALRETRPVQKELVIMRCGFIMPHQSLSANRRLFPLRLWKSKQFTQTPRKSLQYTIQKHNILFLPNNKETSCRDFFLSPFFFIRDGWQSASSLWQSCLCWNLPATNVCRIRLKNNITISILAFNQIIVTSNSFAQRNLYLRF